MGKKLKNIILVTFDQHRVDYPQMSYSIASMLATLKRYKVQASHYSFNIKSFKKTNDGYMPIEAVLDLNEITDYLKKFSCIAIGITRWSETFAYMLIRNLDDYNGKIVVGGYEITAMKETHFMIDFFKNIQHFIKGYAEKPLIKIMNGEYENDHKIINEDLDHKYLFSPYSEGILNIYGRKIYWETKRGCSFKCGFCEWGNANTGMLSLKPETIDRDIEIFSQSTIDEINILDATFNVKNDYLGILRKLIKKTKSKITFQARFEALKPEFLEFCAPHKDRLHLEFGLQTIHKIEMEVIGRSNNMELIKEKLNELNQLGLDYEVSIIYAIPRQTITSLIDTIEFLRINHCKKIMAYPLQIPENSELENKIKEYAITFREDEFYVKSVESSTSFSKEEREDMDRIAFSLTQTQKYTGIPNEYLSKIENAQFQYELNSRFLEGQAKLPEPIVLNFKVAVLRFLDVASAKDIAVNGLDLKREVLTGDHNHNGDPYETNRCKVRFGASRYFYVYREKKEG